MTNPKRKPLPKVQKGHFRLPVGGYMSAAGRLRSQQQTSLRNRSHVKITLAGSKTEPTSKP